MNNEQRYKTVNTMCRISRNASLDFHRVLHSIKLTNSRGILSHIVSLVRSALNSLKFEMFQLMVGLRVLKIIIDKMNASANDTRITDMETSRATTVNATINETAENSFDTSKR
jgi:hypothetical protein